LGIPLPIQREFEVVIMVERAIGEMFGSDRNSAPIDYMRAFVIDEVLQPKRNRNNSSEFTPLCAQKTLDTADIVRDVRNADYTDKW
jgi:hypothetical protein